MEKGLLHIRCEITLGKYQDQLLRLEDKLESGLYCELTDKTLHDGYIEYHHKAQLAVGLQADDAVHHVHARAFQLAGPRDPPSFLIFSFFSSDLSPP